MAGNEGGDIVFEKQNGIEHDDEDEKCLALPNYLPLPTLQ